jgi:hypothetical protein
MTGPGLPYVIYVPCSRCGALISITGSYVPPVFCVECKEALKMSRCLKSCGLQPCHRKNVHGKG